MKALTTTLTLVIAFLACSAANAAVVRVGRVAVGVRPHAHMARPVVARPVVARPVVARPVVARPVVARPVVARPVVARPVVVHPARPVAPAAVRPAIRAHRAAAWDAYLNSLQ